MTRYAKPVTGKKEAEEASTWSSLKQTIVHSSSETLKKKKKKHKKLKDSVVCDPKIAGSVPLKIADNQTVVVKKLKKKRNKNKLVADAIKTEANKTLNKTTSNNSSKLGKGTLKFSKLDPEVKRKQRAEVHRNRRAARDPCFVCRSKRHKASNCPKGDGKGIGTCFKCASTEHTSSACPRKDIKGFPHAKCFICNETGHLSRACPDNPRGLYPNGGCCKECGSVEHFAKDCPTKAKQKQNQNIKLKSIKSAKCNVEDDDMMDLNDFIKVKKETKPPSHQPKVVKF